MARQPVPGQTKTRLAAIVGEAVAALLYGAFLLDTLAVCDAVDAATLVSYAPDDEEARCYFRAAAPGALLAPQAEEPFGARLERAMQSAFDRGFTGVAVIGSDIPHMDPGAIRDAFAALDEHDLALGPTRDGGYYLLAVSAPRPLLFSGVDWSSGRELGQTLDRAAALGLRVTLVQEAFDIDDVEDLGRLRELIAVEGPQVCPRTAAQIACLVREGVSSVAGVDR